MKRISIIAAVDRNMGLGKDNNLLCHLPADLKNFKKLTTNKTIVMGRKTWESLPIKPLPNRTNIVLTKNDIKSKDCIVKHSLKDILDMDFDELMVIGGSSVYEQFLPHADTLYLTHIDAEFEADVFFPEFDKSWIKTNESVYNEDSNNLRHTYIEYNKAKI